MILTISAHKRHDSAQVPGSEACKRSLSERARRREARTLLQPDSLTDTHTYTQPQSVKVTRKRTLLLMILHTLFKQFSCSQREVEPKAQTRATNTRKLISIAYGSIMLPCRVCHAPRSGSFPNRSVYIYCHSN